MGFHSIEESEQKKSCDSLAMALRVCFSTLIETTVASHTSTTDKRSRPSKRGLLLADSSRSSTQSRGGLVDQQDLLLDRPGRSALLAVSIAQRLHQEPSLQAGRIAAATCKEIVACNCVNVRQENWWEIPKDPAPASTCKSKKGDERVELLWVAEFVAFAYEADRR